MKLECKIRRQGGTQVELVVGDTLTPYHFKPLDPTREDSPHVCDVSDMTHLSRFISLAPECYVPFEDKAPKAELAKPTAADPAMQATPSDPLPPPAAKPDSFGTATAADTNGNGKLSVAELSAGIAAQQFSPEQLRELMAQEEASAEPRAGFIKVITKALK